MTDIEHETKRHLTGQDYPWLCRFCRDRIEDFLPVERLLDAEGPDREFNEEAACDRVYDVEAFCGGHTCGVMQDTYQNYPGHPRWIRKGLWGLVSDHMGAYRAVESGQQTSKWFIWTSRSLRAWGLQLLDEQDLAHLHPLGHRAREREDQDD